MKIKTRNDFVRNPDFIKTRDRKVVTNAICKYTTERERLSDCRRSETNRQGIWEEGQKRLLVDTYTGIFIPHADAKVAATLCKISPVKYALKGKSGLSNDWLL